MIRKLILILLVFISSALCAKEPIYLRDNLAKVKPGNYIVASQGKAYTLLHINERQGATLTIEEITTPATSIPKEQHSWREWVKLGAPGHTSWIMYQINLDTGKMSDHYSFTRKGWFNVPKKNHFLSTLLYLPLKFIPLNKRKKVGHRPPIGLPDKRRLWSPRMVVDGNVIQGVTFDAWKTHWPKDGSELSDKTIEVYVPEDNETYPSYFPYWMQISGMIGKAKVRIVDSGSHLESPQRIFNAKTQRHEER